MAPAAPSRRTIKLRESLNYDLNVYALAAGAAGIGALAMPQPARAQIVYTPAHTVLEAGSTVNLDLNHDGITDVAIVDRVSIGRSGHTFSARASLLAIPGARPYGGVARRYYNAAGAFKPGQKIGNSRSFDSQKDLMCTAYLGLDYYFGSWMPFATNGYLGVRFTLNGKPHFAWVRMNTTWNENKSGIKALITGYAYETRPGVAIAAGDRGDRTSVVPADSISESPSKKTRASLGALALGSDGLAIWRRP
jgi:hypothetical protein